MSVLLFTFISCLCLVAADDMLLDEFPTVYEHYTSGGITNGLSANQSYFTLNNKNITIYSGAIHYFRVPKDYWRDRLKKLRAAGLNTVETYVPWNLHEPRSGQFDFGNGGSDFEEFLDVRTFLETAKEEDLLAIVRPGPYICTEWEFGGFPSWLLRNGDIKFRTSQSTYMKYVTRYFNTLLPILAELQFTKGGPIIAFQVENEYGSTERKNFVPDRTYLRELRELMHKNGIVELLVSSDDPVAHGDVGTLPGEFLQTANFQSNPETEFEALKKLQPNKPLMAMEFWAGWFDHWSEHHNTFASSSFDDVYRRILKYNASVNLYMFHGGTSFGFLNGANLNNALTDNSGFQPDTTSYDYDAPLTENGNYTAKYAMIKSLLEKYNPVKLKNFIPPAVQDCISYPPLIVERQIPFSGITQQAPEIVEYETVLPMEQLPINNGSGQSYGYIVYRKENINIPRNANLIISGHICDSLMVLVNGILISKPLRKSSDLNEFGYWRIANSSITLTLQDLSNATIDLIIENWGRVNFGSVEQFYQFKGLWQGDVYLNNEPVRNWKIIPLEFKKAWNNNLSGWKPFQVSTIGPALYEATLEVVIPQDTFLDMQDWTKGIVIINGFVLGRYARIGPQQALYLPAPFLKRGSNKFLIFEHFIPASTINFSDKQIFKTI